MDFYTLGKRLASHLTELMAEAGETATAEELYSLFGNGAGRAELFSGISGGLNDIAGWMEAGDRP